MVDTPITRVWDALTNNEQMKKWYFSLADFKPVVGFEFSFIGKTEEGKEYLHLCKVTDVVAGKKLAYSWRYDGYPGNSVVSFDLSEDGGKTKLRLTHAGLKHLLQVVLILQGKFCPGLDRNTDQSLKGFLEKTTVHNY
jgi:uncharacterized protein YndB with AHSA1/START domain